MLLKKKPSKPVSVHPLDRITAYQDDSKLSRIAQSRLSRHRECCDEARRVECQCLLAIECDKHGKHCFGPHRWPDYWNEAA